MNLRVCLGLLLPALVLCSCTSGKLTVPKVCYQSLRTDFAQPTSIPPEAKIAVEYFFNKDGKMQPVVYNLTSEILILDQTKSFVIMPGGKSVSYYDPNTYTTTTGDFHSETSSASFNLGAIAGILGLGGPLGSLMGATTLGSATTDGVYRQNSVAITDQPLVHIGPKGSVAMSKAYEIAGVGFSGSYLSNVIDSNPKTEELQFSVCVTYSLDDGNTFEKLVTKFYVSSNINQPVVNKKVSKAFYEIYAKKPDALAENMYMFLLPNNIKETTSSPMAGFAVHDSVYDFYVRGSLIDYQ